MPINETLLHPFYLVPSFRVPNQDCMCVKPVDSEGLWLHQYAPWSLFLWLVPWDRLPGDYNWPMMYLSLVPIGMLLERYFTESGDMVPVLPISLVLSLVPLLLPRHLVCFLMVVASEFTHCRT